MKEYVVLIGGLPHTVLLDAEEAARIGAVPVAPLVKTAAPANKARAGDLKNKS